MSAPSLFQRLILPGLAFKAVVIGGGYATGRELAEFFLPSGPVGGLMGLTLAMVIWSVVCAVTFVFARATASSNYRDFFRRLLGPFWLVFEVAYVCFLLLILSVFGAAAGEIGAAVFGWPRFVGAALLAVCILTVTALGQNSVERLFKYASIFLYAVYAVFVALCFTRFGGDVLATLDQSIPPQGWAGAGLTYAGYNIVGAVVILPVLRHLTSHRDAVTAGLLAGPLAALPAIVFFLCMLAFHPEIAGAALPSNYILERLGSPAFQLVFQFMIFIALLETSAGAVHAVNERIAGARRKPLTARARLVVAGALVLAAMVIAERFGLIALIANGYRILSWMILLTFVAPLMTIGLWKLRGLLKARREAVP
jgi:uncharacterized membrane protein YkvI